MLQLCIVRSRVVLCAHAWYCALTRGIVRSRVVLCAHAWYCALTRGFGDGPFQLVTLEPEKTGLAFFKNVYIYLEKDPTNEFIKPPHVAIAIQSLLMCPAQCTSFNVHFLLQLSTYIVEITAEIELRDAIYCMCLSLNGLVILLALFGPKVYIAILRPEKNNQATVMCEYHRNFEFFHISNLLLQKLFLLMVYFG